MKSYSIYIIFKWMPCNWGQCPPSRQPTPIHAAHWAPPNPMTWLTSNHAVHPRFLVGSGPATPFLYPISRPRAHCDAWHALDTSRCHFLTRLWCHQWKNHVSFPFHPWLPYKVYCSMATYNALHRRWFSIPFDQHRWSGAMWNDH